MLHFRNARVIPLPLTSQRSTKGSGGNPEPFVDQVDDLLAASDIELLVDIVRFVIPAPPCKRNRSPREPGFIVLLRRFALTLKQVDQFLLGMHVGFAVDALNVALHGFVADNQLLAYVGAAASLRQQEEHLDLSRRQAAAAGKARAVFACVKMAQRLRNARGRGGKGGAAWATMLRCLTFRRCAAGAWSVPRVRLAVERNRHARIHPPSRAIEHRPR